MSTDDGMEHPDVIALDDHAALLDDYAAAIAARDAADREARQLRELIEKLLPDAAPDGVVGTVGGRVRLTYRPHAARLLDVISLRSRYPGIAEECTKWVTRRPFRVIRAGA